MQRFPPTHPELHVLGWKSGLSLIPGCPLLLPGRRAQGTGSLPFKPLDQQQGQLCPLCVPAPTETRSYSAEATNLQAVFLKKILNRPIWLWSTNRSSQLPDRNMASSQNPQTLACCSVVSGEDREQLLEVKVSTMGRAPKTASLPSPAPITNSGSGLCTQPLRGRRGDR